MSAYLFAASLLPGKTETWRKYVQEMQGARRDEWIKSRQKTGLAVEQVWLQKTPIGDFAVVRLEGDNPERSFEQLMKSNEPFDRWFREKIIIECHGVDVSQPPPSPNEMVLDYHGQQVGAEQYAEARRK